MGILGGTFNPPHLGHLVLARAAIAELALERVLLVPARIAPHKQLSDDPGPDHRMAMCRLLASEEPLLEVSELELDRPAPSYTVDTLQAIHATHPRAELILILGADMACTLPTWREPRRILELARLAVAVRAGTKPDAVREALRGLDARDRAVLLSMPPVEISSADVRDRVHAGRRVDGLLTRPVLDYIASHGLYREGTAFTSSPQQPARASRPISDGPVVR